MTTIETFKRLITNACSQLEIVVRGISNKTDLNSYILLSPDEDAGLLIPISVYKIQGFPFQDSVTAQSLFDDLDECWRALFLEICNVTNNPELRDQAWRIQKELHERLSKNMLLKRPYQNDAMTEIDNKISAMSTSLKKISNVLMNVCQTNRSALINTLNGMTANNSTVITKGDNRKAYSAYPGESYKSFRIAKDSTSVELNSRTFQITRAADWSLIDQAFNQAKNNNKGFPISCSTDNFNKLSKMANEFAKIWIVREVHKGKGNKKYTGYARFKTENLK